MGVHGAMTTITFMRPWGAQLNESHSSRSLVTLTNRPASRTEVPTTRTARKGSIRIERQSESEREDSFLASRKSAGVLSWK